MAKLPPTAGNISIHLFRNLSRPEEFDNGPSLYENRASGKLVQNGFKLWEEIELFSFDPDDLQ
jgi:hypothetical protein